MEELANLELTSSVIGVRAYGETEKELGEILEKLQEDNEIEAYGQTGNTTITGITFGQVVEENGIELEIGEEKAVEKTVTFTSSDPSKDYYVQIRGKKYPIAKRNGVIKITKTEITTGTNATGEITDVSSNHEEYATVEQVSGTTDKIKITGVAKGTATITAKYTNEIYATIPVTVKGNVTVSTQVVNMSDVENVGTATAISNVAYAEGSTISLTATVANNDYQFVGWYETKDGETETQISTDVLYMYTIPNDGTVSVVLKAKFKKKPEPLGASESGVGYYIQKGDEYAIVFADRIAQAGATVTWEGARNCSCNFPTLSSTNITTFKTYAISNKTYEDSYFGKHKVIEILDDTKEQDRFIAMSLKDFSTSMSSVTSYCWYAGAKSSRLARDVTDSGVNSGKNNTTTMMTQWEGSLFGTQNVNSSYPDVWGAIAGEVENDWFVPSEAEWIAFAGTRMNGKIIGCNRSIFGLSSIYWSSSQQQNNSGWYNMASFIRFDTWEVSKDYVDYDHKVRLATTY